MESFNNWLEDIHGLLRRPPKDDMVAQILYLQAVIYDATKACEMIAREIEELSYGGTDD